MTCFSPGEYEYESYDGWYNNPAHPEWGGAGMLLFCLYHKRRMTFSHATDMPLERKVPIDYYDGVFSPSGNDRPNVMIISNLTFDGLTGQGSAQRTALFTFYGKQL